MGSLNTMQAKPTEYRGTRYRSKSEAIFARCLDTSTAVAVWEYEPVATVAGGTLAVHPWDFLVETYSEFVAHGRMVLAIEYKPYEPAPAYIEPLRERYLGELSKCKEAGSFSQMLPAALVWGSPFNGPPPGIENNGNPYVLFPFAVDDPGPRLFDDNCDIAKVLGITAEHAEEARGYRFDLREQQ